MNDIKGFVIDYFRKKGLDKENECEVLLCDYLDQRLIDSFGIVELITTMEDKFGIHFTPADMQSRKFRTIGGLIEIISEKQYHK